MTLSELKQGTVGIVKEFTDLEMSVKLMEMGCLPGEEITIAYCNLQLHLHVM